jgi:hypothetical protein
MYRYSVVRGYSVYAQFTDFDTLDSATKFFLRKREIYVNGGDAGMRWIELIGFDPARGIIRLAFYTVENSI